MSLVDNSRGDLIRKLYVAFARFQNPGVIRKARDKELTDTLYEQDYKQANARLADKTWKSMDLDTAAFLIGFQGCLGVNERLALLPFFFEILLRAEAWVWPFDLIVTPLRRKKGNPFGFEVAYQDASLRGLVASALDAVGAKYSNDAKFSSTEAATILERAKRDWES